MIWPAEILIVVLGVDLPAKVSHSCDLVREPPEFCGVDLHSPKSPDTMAVPTICKSSNCLRAEAVESCGKLWFSLKPGVLGVQCVLLEKNINSMGEGSTAMLWDVFGSAFPVW